MDTERDLAPVMLVVFLGPKAVSREYSLVLEATGIEHELTEENQGWSLKVPADRLTQAEEELVRYAGERKAPRYAPATEPRRGASFGVMAYSLLLVFTAYAAEQHAFGADWLARGALDAGAARIEWWRAITALTLHIDPAHLFSNLLAGSLVGIAASRLVGPGVAWAGAFGAGALANLVEMWIAPTSHRAVGASTAVFALLGMLTGLAWTQRMQRRERQWYRWAPLIAGVCLLTLFGAGNADVHVDVLGHLLGFLIGMAAGWFYPRMRPLHQGVLIQIGAGVGTCCLIALAWMLAL